MPNSPAEERFELPITIRPDDIDELGHVNNVVYLRWVQDVATAHWRSAATQDQQTDLIWVVVRHEIDYKHSAKLEDEIIARTWVGTAGVASFERHTEIVRKSDLSLLARARTLWCPIRISTGRPTRVPDEIRKRFSVPSNE
ncbi:MAG: thioesterase family protein [Bacteroidota bacterium]|jgi:acyl-CoA thioester hydrolase